MQNVQRKPLQPGQTSPMAENRPKSNASSVELASTHSVSPPGYATPLSSASTTRGQVSPLSSNGSLPNTLARVNSNAAPEVFSLISDATARRTGSTASMLSEATRRSSVPQGLTPPNKTANSPSDQREHSYSSHFCKLCSHCRQGILYNELYFQCIFCRVFVCEKCHEKHPSSHSRELVQIISKKCDSKSTTEKRLCLGCSKTAVSCMECKECNAAFCEECFQQKAADHDHRIFFSLEAPYHQVKLNSGSSQACCAKPAISHCTWCLKSIALSQHSLQCKTCLVSAGISVSVCEHCFPDAWAFHDQTHQSMSIAFIPVVDDSENGYGCSQCKYKFRSLDGATLLRHEHNTYLNFIAPRERESMMSLSYRVCQRKAVRIDQFGLSQCARCKHHFPTDQVRICAGDNCNGSFCEHCFPQASVNHIHGPSNFRCSADVARPDIGFLPEGWRALQNNDGRVYYLHERSKNFTFFKPALPKTLPPGWTTALDTQGKTMYIDPNTRTATYVNPLYGVAPPGYELKQNETGRLFYVNRQTGAATWHKPLAIEPLPTGWEAGQTADGRIYYINHVTKTNTWTKPTSPAQATQPTVHSVRPSAPATTQSAPIIAPTHQPIQVAKPAASTNFPVRPTAQKIRPPSTVAGNPMASPSTSAQVGAVRPAPMGVVRPPQQTMQPRPSQGGTALQAQSSSLQGVVNSVQPLTSSLPSTTVPLQPTSPQLSSTGSYAASNQARPPLHSRVFSAPSTTSAATAGAKLQDSITAMARNPNVQNAAAGLGRFALRAALSDGNDTGDSGSVEFQSTESISFETGDSDMSQSQNFAANEQYLETPSLQTQDVSPNPAPPSASSDIVYAQNSVLGGEVPAPTYVYDSSCAYPTDNTGTPQGSGEYALGNPQPQYIGDPSNPQILSSNLVSTQTYSSQSNVPVANESSSVQMHSLSVPQYQSDNNVTYIDYTSQPSSTPQIIENNNTVINMETIPATQYQQEPITDADIAVSAAAGYATTPYDPSTQLSSLGISDYNDPNAAVTNATLQSPAIASTQVAPQYSTTSDQSILSSDALAASEAIAIDGQNASLELI